jgi:hypothetical protein
VILEVAVEQNRERWSRRFPNVTVVSTQWERDQLLIEAFGPSSFSCQLKLAGPNLVYEFRQAWLAGVPLPSWLSPRVDGVVTGDESGWKVVVRILAPALGEILRYEGRVEPE